MMMHAPTVPHGYVNAPSYDELVTTLDLIRHATALSDNDDAYHENAHELAAGILTRVEARRRQDGLAA